jgi:hypothetical protein
MAIKKRWIEALAETAARETVHLPWTRGSRTRRPSEAATIEAEAADATPA